MALTDLPLFQALKSKMQWHQVRQGVLSQNIAHSDTPGYGAKDLKAYSFRDHVERQTMPLQTVRTDSGHLTGAVSDSALGRGTEEVGFEITPSGNSVVLEEQMMKVTQNQMDYQAATTLYTKGLGLLRTALSKNA
ncbi:flagellar basal body rod protein FlgB [Roseibium sp. RKSG952]|uniref:flagellar basal body rod protein FlgB n=1 Tax=Roseibium sp. RKSG952 TaxID=2529384 RepID=UPI0012BBFB49|nr:flagellar basal body rod protein FlgB [Roseibium sp. RKSG952]MTH97633.1 flagellar basal body rod protein FlgB [Roseibium sp. RKSG952]